MSKVGPITSAAAAEAQIRRSRVIAILRLDHADGIVDICRTLVGAGLSTVEITTDRPHALASISKVREALGDRVLLGAGTVLDERTVTAAVSAGAAFCVAPNLDPQVVAACRRHHVLAIPGVFSPTEVATASRLGLELVKLFPCGGQSPEFLGALRGPFPVSASFPRAGSGWRLSRDGWARERRRWGSGQRSCARPIPLRTSPPGSGGCCGTSTKHKQALTRLGAPPAMEPPAGSTET